MDTLPFTVTPQVIVVEDHDNLFVRLSSDVLSALIANSTSATRASLAPTVSSTKKEKWTLIPNETETFLPLEISLGEDLMYASYNGGVLEGCTDSIQIPMALLQTKSKGPPDRAHVRVIPRIAYATRVQVDPASTEDWELLQVHAETLESGALLQQVSLIYPDQQLSLWLPTRQRDEIRIVVKEISTASNVEESSPWPPLTNPEKEDNLGQASCMAALLTSSTELVVAPKSREVKNDLDSPTWSQSLQLLPSEQDFGRQVSWGSTPGPRMLAEISPGCVSIHPKTVELDDMEEDVDLYAQICASTCGGTRDNEGEILAVRLFISLDCPEESAVVHPWLRWSLGLPLLSGYIRLRLLNNPTFASVDDITLVNSTIVWGPGQSWREPCFQHAGRHQATTELLGGRSHFEVAVGSLVLLGMDSDFSSDQCFRISLQDNAARDVGGQMILQERGIARLRDLAINALKSEEGKVTDQVALPRTDKLVCSVPSLIFKSSVDSLDHFLHCLQIGVSFFGVLCGSTGVGKTHTSQVLSFAAATVHRHATLYLDCKLLQESLTSIAEILSELDRLFFDTQKSKKALVILDDLDRIAPNMLGGSVGDPGSQTQGANPVAIDQSRLISDRIVQLLEAANKPADTIVSIVATCTSENSLNSALCFNKRTISIPMLDSYERFQLFSDFLQACSEASADATSISERSFGRQTGGFRPKDIEKIALRVRHLTTMDSSVGTTCSENIEAVLRDYTPLSHIGIDKPKAMKGLSWLEIGGLFDVKNKLEKTLLNPVRYQAIYALAKIRLPRGILLFGPTGCGKTVLVSALAEKCKFPLISCRGPEVLDKYIGSSEANIRELFHRAASVAPSILFLDELDALAPRRGSDHTGVTDRVVNQLLTFLDGVEDTSDATVYVIGATSRPDKIDPALLRPGRLEQHLFVSPPHDDNEWEDLIRKSASDWNLSSSCRALICSEEGIARIIRMVRKYPHVCPSDIKGAMDTAHLNAIHRMLKVKEAADIQYVDIEVEDLERAFSAMRPCLSPSDARVLSEIYRRFYVKADSATNPPPQKLKTTLR